MNRKPSSRRRRNPRDLLAHTVAGRKAIREAVTAQMDAMPGMGGVSVYQNTATLLRFNDTQRSNSHGDAAVRVWFGPESVSVGPETRAGPIVRRVTLAGQTATAVVAEVMAIVRRFAREPAFWTNHIPVISVNGRLTDDLGKWAPGLPLPNPARRNPAKPPAEYSYEITVKIGSHIPTTFYADTKEEADRKLANIQMRYPKAKMRRVRVNPADPLAHGRGPVPPRVAQAAVDIIGWDAAERIVGPGLLGGASGYDLNRLVWAAKVERERQGGKSAITRRKRNPANSLAYGVPQFRYDVDVATRPYPPDSPDGLRWTQVIYAPSMKEARRRMIKDVFDPGDRIVAIRKHRP